MILTLISIQRALALTCVEHPMQIKYIWFNETSVQVNKWEKYTVSK